MFLVELKCDKCKRKLSKNDEIFIKTKVSNLNGITNLKSWAVNQNIYCKTCYEINVTK